jgi:hypothetical protein
MGKSLKQVVREYLEELAAGGEAEAWTAEFDRLSQRIHGHSRGWSFHRQEIHART